MRMYDIIKKKRDGEELSPEDRQKSLTDMFRLALEIA